MDLARERARKRRRGIKEKKGDKGGERGRMGGEGIKGERGWGGGAGGERMDQGLIKGQSLSIW
jgi:hypothetical protein